MPGALPIAGLAGAGCAVGPAGDTCRSGQTRSALGQQPAAGGRRGCGAAGEDERGSGSGAPHVIISRVSSRHVSQIWSGPPHVFLCRLSSEMSLVPIWQPATPQVWTSSLPQARFQCLDASLTLFSEPPYFPPCWKPCGQSGFGQHRRVSIGRSGKTFSWFAGIAGTGVCFLMWISRLTARVGANGVRHYVLMAVKCNRTAERSHGGSSRPGGRRALFLLHVFWQFGAGQTQIGGQASPFGAKASSTVSPSPATGIIPSRRLLLRAPLACCDTMPSSCARRRLSLLSWMALDPMQAAAAAAARSGTQRSGGERPGQRRGGEGREFERRCALSKAAAKARCCASLLCVMKEVLKCAKPFALMAASAPLAVAIVPGLGAAGRGSVMVPSSPPVSAAPLLLSGLLDIASMQVLQQGRAVDVEERRGGEVSGGAAAAGPASAD